MLKNFINLLSVNAVIDCNPLLYKTVILDVFELILDESPCYLTLASDGIWVRLFYDENHVDLKQ